MQINIQSVTDDYIQDSLANPAESCRFDLLTFYISGVAVLAQCNLCRGLNGTILFPLPIEEWGIPD